MPTIINASSYTIDGVTYPYFASKQDAEQAMLNHTIPSGTKVVLPQTSFPDGGPGGVYVYQQGLAPIIWVGAIIITAIIFTILFNVTVSTVKHFIVEVKQASFPKTETLPNGDHLVLAPDGSSYIIDKDGNVKQVSHPAPKSTTGNIADTVKYAGIFAGVLVVGIVVSRTVKKQPETTPAPAPQVIDAKFTAKPAKARTLRAPSMKSMRRLPA